MSGITPGGHERRRNPRFSCDGEAKIICLPADGLLLPGKVRDLSLGGCCVETTSPLDCGARAEIVVRVHSASFRALSQVRAIRERSGACMEFVYLSAGGKDLLEELISELAKLQALMNSLKSSRRETDAELLEQLESGGLQAMLNQRFPVIGTLLIPDHREEASVAQDGPRLILEAQPKVIPLDLFI